MDWDLPEPFVHRRVAQPAEIDAYGHVNNSIYVVWIDECAWAHATKVGLGLDTCLRLQRGMAVHRTQIHYLKSALAGDEIEVATWPVLNDHRLRIDRRFQIRRAADGETLLRALIHYVCIDLVTGRARRMPVEFTHYAVSPVVAQAIALETVPYQPGVEARE
jgi:acyl-CoA thioester hydrolase